MSRTQESQGEITDTWLRIDAHTVDARGHPKEIEEDIITELVKRHETWIAAQI